MCPLKPGVRGYCDYWPSEATLLTRTDWFIAYNIRLESLLPAMQELCFPKFAEVVGRQTDARTHAHTPPHTTLILSLYKIYIGMFKRSNAWVNI